MNSPYAPFRLKHNPKTNEAAFFQKTGSGFLESPIARPYSRDRNVPIPALGANMAETRENSIH
jgi:hypothetical protein